MLAAELTVEQESGPAVAGSVALIVGTRPESIKMAPVADQLGDDAVVVHTGQHDYPGMIQPHPHGHAMGLSPLQGSSRGAWLGHTIAALDALSTTLCPAVVAVQGDTTPNSPPPTPNSFATDKQPTGTYSRSSAAPSTKNSSPNASTR